MKNHYFSNLLLAITVKYPTDIFTDYEKFVHRLMGSALFYEFMCNESAMNSVENPLRLSLTIRIRYRNRRLAVVVA
ncbi:hypothetical protein T4A_41 [Trichinella pseudospiralis]|uniref:Uncharacterized protein n=1 Tax=Trichinella pseudospiralis TaxID=6337 RepID=A0A0V1ERH8_TRIPS|nr:hypothetical protein T4A_41 [Trichinella pseudospiralis]